MASRASSRTLTAFAPVSGHGARLLILGSMPGMASLQAGEYYAHPRNAFWPILESVWGIPRSAGYAARRRAAISAGIAIWDVLSSCRRPTSLDADIDPASIVANDFAAFFRNHSGIQTIAFNGGTAATLYRRHVLPTLPARWRGLTMIQLPSTSPAHARLNLQQKLRAWAQLRHS